MSLELFVEHLTGEPCHANEDLFRHLVSTLPPRRQEAVLLHFRDGLPYKTVGEKLDGITSSRAMQLAEMGVRRIRERIAMDTGIVPLPVDKPEHGEMIRTIIAGTIEDYQALIEAKQQRKAAAEARALEAHSSDSIDSLLLTLPTHRTLARANITTVGQLVVMSEAELRSLGSVNMKNIISRLGNLGLRLSTAKAAPADPDSPF